MLSEDSLEDESDEDEDDDHYEDQLSEASAEVSTETEWNEDLSEDHHGWNDDIVDEYQWNRRHNEIFEHVYSCFCVSSLNRVCHLMHI